MGTLSNPFLHYWQIIFEPPGICSSLPEQGWSSVFLWPLLKGLAPDLVIASSFYHSITLLKSPYPISRPYTLALRHHSPSQDPHAPLQNPTSYFKTLHPASRLPALTQDPVPCVKMQHSALITHVPFQDLIPRLKTPALCLKNPFLASTPTSKTYTLSQGPHTSSKSSTPHPKTTFQNPASSCLRPCLISRPHTLPQDPTFCLKTPHSFSSSYSISGSHTLPQNLTS